MFLLDNKSTIETLGKEDISDEMFTNKFGKTNSISITSNVEYIYSTDRAFGTFT